jgi:hypothetical protein
MKNLMEINKVDCGASANISHAAGAASAGAAQWATTKLGKFMKQDLSNKWSYPFSQRSHDMLPEVVSRPSAALCSKLDLAEGRPS